MREREPAVFDREIEESIEIAATPAEVWWRLTDFAGYADWNPFIVSIRGDLDVGARLTVILKPGGLPPVVMRPRLLAVRPRRELRWRGGLGLPDLLNGEHAFIIEPIAADRVRFIQRERLHGLFVPGAMALIGDSTLTGVRAMNEALRRCAEALHARAEVARARRRVHNSA